MVEISDIQDEASFRGWLEDQPQEVATWIAFRAAARVLPIWWQGVSDHTWAGMHDRTRLPGLSGLLFLLVSTNSDIELSLKLKAAARELKKDASFAGDEATEIGSAIGRHPDIESPEHRPQMRTLYRAASASQALALAAEANKLEEFVHAAIAATKIHGDWSVVRKDATDVERGSNPMRRPLWYDKSNPFADECKYIQRSGVVGGGRENWTFWIDWYQSLLDGRPMLGDEARTWDMLEEIALIDPKDWDQGPEVVNPMIAGIWELYRLRIEAEELRAGKEAFLAARATPEQRSHNQPPGLVEAEPEIARHVTIIWTGLDEAHEVLANDAPDKGRLRAIAGSVLEALQRVAKYCARVADTAVMSSAKVGGGAAGAALLDHVLNNGRLIQFAKDLLAWSSVGG